MVVQIVGLIDLSHAIFPHKTLLHDIFARVEASEGNQFDLHDAPSFRLVRLRFFL